MTSDLSVAEFMLRWWRRGGAGKKGAHDQSPLGKRVQRVLRCAVHVRVPRVRGGDPVVLDRDTGSVDVGLTGRACFDI
jgi:hypothetical protein